MTTIPDSLRSALADSYHLEREIGHGGMATVYLARDVKHRRRVAVKVLRPELAASLGADRFLKEIEIAAGLTHPHILTLIDSGEADNTLYYVMPFVDGESVRGFLEREGPLSLDDALAVTRKVADALAYAHRMGVVHRDIKPENILLSQGHAVVADFGIARAISTAGVANLTRTGFPIGTPGYMSPEQAAGRSDLDATTDVYSLACVVYEMLIGDTPGMWVSEESLRMERFLDATDSHRERLDLHSGSVEQTLVRAMAMRPADRFASPMDFVAAFEGIKSDRPRYGNTQVKDIVKRASDLQVSKPTEDAGLTIGSVEQIAAEVGISPARVRQAVHSMERSTIVDQPSWVIGLAGAPTTLTFERTIEGEVSETEYPILVEDIRATLKNVGHVSTLARSLAWTTASPSPGQGRDVHVTITPRHGRTRIRIEEKMAAIVGGLFGGIVGGGGGGGGAALAGLGVALFGPPLGVVLGVATALGGSYALARTIYKGVAARRSRQLDMLIDRLADYMSDTAVKGPLGRSSGPRLAP